MKRTEDAVLVIDDIRTFSFPCTYAKSIKQAKSLLYAQKWREVWLDYDIGDRGNLKPIMKEIESGKRPEVTQFIIHTASYEGRRMMRKTLIAAGYMVIEVFPGAYMERHDP